MLLVIGDLNAKVGGDNSSFERTMGIHGCGAMNENGEYLADFCSSNRLVIGGTIFPHKDIHKLTWTSPDGATTNQIDHIMINSKWRRSLQDVRVYRGADANSNHFLVAASIKLKLRKAAAQGQQRKRLDIPQLKNPQTRANFVLELKNRFSALADEGSFELNDVNQKWDTIKSTYCATAEAVLGFKKRKNKEWLTPGTWNLIDERRSLKEKLLNTKSPRLQERAKEAYKRKDKVVKRSARSDKRKRVWLGKLNRLQREEIWALSTRSPNSLVESGTTTLPQLRTKMAIPYQLSTSRRSAGYSTSRMSLTILIHMNQPSPLPVKVSQISTSTHLLRMKSGEPS